MASELAEAPPAASFPGARADKAHFNSATVSTLRSERPAVASRETEPAAASRSTKRIAGGFSGLGADLDRHAREWQHIHRQMEQQRPQLEAAEAERKRLYAALDTTTKQVAEADRALREAIETARAGEQTTELGALFERNREKLADLEGVSQALSVNLQAIQNVWEQYTQTVERARVLREQIHSDGR